MADANDAQAGGAQGGEQAPPAVPMNNQALSIQPPTHMKSIDKWKIWRQMWTNYSVLTNLDKQSNEYQTSLFLYSIGPMKSITALVLAQMRMTKMLKQSLKSLMNTQ